MTTVAANLRVMVGDSKVTGVFYHTDKVFRIGGALVGVCGSAEYTTKFLAWFRKECPAGEDLMGVPDTSDFGALVLKDGALYYYTDCAEPDRLHEKFFAIGSGADAAMAAMYLGKDPLTAVKIAAKVDNNTGGPFKVLEADPHKKRRPKKPAPQPEQPSTTENTGGETDA